MSNGKDFNLQRFKSRLILKAQSNPESLSPKEKQILEGLVNQADPLVVESAVKGYQPQIEKIVQQQRASDTRGTNRKDSQTKPTTDSGVEYRQNMAAGAQALTKQLTQSQQEYKGMSQKEGTEAGLLSGAGAALPFFMAGGVPGIAAGLGAIAVGGIMGSKKAKAARQQFESEIAEKRKLIEEEREEQRKQNYYNRRQSAFNNLMQSLNQAMS